MSARDGRWELLDRESDPVTADRAGVDDRVTHYQQVAEAIRTESGRLHRIASGAALQGKYADELRSSAGDVAKDLDQVQGRYDAVASALRDYGPALDAALSGTWQALQDAEDADTASTQANGMPQNTAPEGQTLTANQQAENDDRTKAVNAAADRMSAAKAKLATVLDVLDTAGRAAASRIRGSFGDGLTDSGWDKFKAGFANFLKILVKVLTYIAIALAALALLIPGVGELVMAAGAALAAITVVANAALVGMGEGSWADLGVAIAGLLTFGVGKVLGPAIQGAVSAIGKATGKAGSAIGSVIRGGGRAGAGEDVQLSLRGGGSSSRNSLTTPRPEAGDPPPRVDWEPGRSHLEPGQVNDPENAVRTYTSAAYIRINGFLRGKGNDFNAAKSDFSTGERGARDAFRSVGEATAADSWLREASTGEVITTFRGVRQPYIKDVLDEQKIGSILEEKGMMSTSAKRKFAEDWAGAKGVLLQVTGRSGADVRGVAMVPEQQEHVYPSGTEFQVTGRTTNEEGHLTHMSLQEIRVPHVPPVTVPSAANPAAGRAEWPDWLRKP